MFTPDYEDQRGVPGIARGISWMREAPSSRWSERIYQKYVGPGDRAASARAAPPQLAILQLPAESRESTSCPSRSTSFRSCPAGRASA